METQAAGGAPPGARIARKLLAVMGAIRSVAKDGENTFHRYRYASDSAIFTAVRQACIEHGVMVLPTVVERQDVELAKQDKAPMQWCRLRLAITFTDVESGESWTTEVWGDGSDQTDKACYKALTGALKYGCKAAFLIPTGDGDPDDDDDRGQRPDPRQQQRPDPRQQQRRPPAGPAAACACPCGCNNTVSSELATHGLSRLGAVRCRECYPATGFVEAKHADLDDLKLPKYPEGFTVSRAVEIAAQGAASRSAS